MNNVKQHAGKWFQLLRRLQEMDADGVVTCISCDKKILWCECDGGHYVPRQYVATFLNSANVQPQCKRCNCFRRNDPYVHARFAAGIDKKYGKGTADALLACKNATLKMTSAQWWIAAKKHKQDAEKICEWRAINLRIYVNYLYREHARIAKGMDYE